MTSWTALADGDAMERSWIAKWRAAGVPIVEREGDFNAPARAWVDRLPFDITRSLDKLVLGKMWDFAETVTSWGVPVVRCDSCEIAMALGLPMDAKPEIRHARNRLIKMGWVARHDIFHTLSWLEPFPPERCGHVYALEFSNFVVKVGRSKTPAARVQTHINMANRFGIGCRQFWMFGPVADAISAEKEMVRHLRAQCQPVAGSEYFRGGYELAAFVGVGRGWDNRAFLGDAYTEVAPCI